MFQLGLTDKIEFFSSTVVWRAIGWDHEETCFYWQHKTAKTVIRVYCDSLKVAKREMLSHAITVKRGSAKPLVEYISDREGSAIAFDELQQSLHPIARLSVKPKTEAETVKAEAGGSQGGVDVSAGGHGASVSGAADAVRAVGAGTGANSAMPPPLPPIQPIQPLPPQLPQEAARSETAGLRAMVECLGEVKVRASAAEAERVVAAAAQLEALRVEHEASAAAAAATHEARSTAMITAIMAELTAVEGALHAVLVEVGRVSLCTGEMAQREEARTLGGAQAHAEAECERLCREKDVLTAELSELEQRHHELLAQGAAAALAHDAQVQALRAEVSPLLKANGKVGQLDDQLKMALRDMGAQQVRAEAAEAAVAAATAAAAAAAAEHATSQQRLSAELAATQRERDEGQRELERRAVLLEAAMTRVRALEVASESAASTIRAPARAAGTAAAASTRTVANAAGAGAGRGCDGKISQGSNLEGSVGAATGPQPQASPGAAVADAPTAAVGSKRKMPQTPDGATVAAVADKAAVRRVLEARDFFEVLDVTRNATPAEITPAYKRLAREVHPDKNGADEAVEAFKRLNEAHSTLSDPVLRDGYVQRTPMSVWDVLTSMNLAAYADEFNRQGYKDLEVLIMMSKKGQLAQIADNVHMKSGHKSKFLEKLHALETARGTPPPGFRPKS